MKRPAIGWCLYASLLGGASAAVSAPLAMLGAGAVAVLAGSTATKEAFLPGMFFVGIIAAVAGLASALIVGFPVLLLLRHLDHLTAGPIVIAATIVGAITSQILGYAVNPGYFGAGSLDGWFLLLMGWGCIVGAAAGGVAAWQVRRVLNRKRVVHDVAQLGVAASRDT